ncbi:phosphoribosylanthranilate isomerase [Fibrobacterota bacterium]
MPNSKSRIKVKVCGITEEKEAGELDGLGVDFLGFNFYSKSKRFIEPGDAIPIIRRLRHAMPVGIFVDEGPRTVKEIIEETGIRYVQLHGSESNEYIARVPLPVIKAVKHTELEEGLVRSAGNAEFLLFDTAAAGIFGGTGRSFDWGLLSRYKGKAPYFLAGGIGPGNIREALERLRPFCVDLNSKVELSPGRKDLGKIKYCLEQIRAF